MSTYGPRHWAGTCAKCRKTVWLTPGGACGKGHSAEFISDVQEVEAPTGPLGELIHCRTCGAELYGEIPACGGCGFPPSAGTAFCPECGTPTLAGQVMCTECGAALSASKPELEDQAPKVGVSWSPWDNDLARGIGGGAQDSATGVPGPSRRTSECECGRSLDSDDLFCPECGKKIVTSKTPELDRPIAVSTTPPRSLRGYYAVIAALVLAALVVAVVGGTRGECVRRRTDIGEVSYFSEMLGGANGTDVQSSLAARTRCPLGFVYSTDLVCPIHGELTLSDRQRVIQNTRGVYGY